MIKALKKYWWLIALAIAVLIFKVFPDKLPFLERIDTNFPPWVAEQLSKLKDNVTLAQWKKDYPDEDVVWPVSGDQIGVLINDTWCARTMLSVDLPGGKTAVRHAFFYPPAAPATFVLPGEEEITKDYVDNNCRLGIIWVKMLERDKDQGNSLAVQVRDAIDQRLGKGEADIPLKRVDAKYLSRTGRWQVGNAVFISAYNTFPTIASKSRDHVTLEKKFFALGYLPASGFYNDGERSYSKGYEINREDNVQRIREAIMTASISRKDGDALLSYFPENGGAPTLKLDQAESLVALLERWVTASDKLDKTRKAAGLIAADQVLAHMKGSLRFTDIKKGKPDHVLRLEKLGAKFYPWEIANEFSYSHAWLERAQEIDKDGPMGDLAFRILMDMGCDGGLLQYQAIIDQGEAYLKKADNAETKAEVELMVAEAYRDIVALSAGAGADNENPGAYQEAAIDARQKAIMHYRNSLPKMKPSPLINEAWQEAWRLLVGLPPTNLRYYCIYD